MDLLWLFVFSDFPVFVSVTGIQQINMNDKNNTRVIKQFVSLASEFVYNYIESVSTLTSVPPHTFQCNKSNLPSLLKHREEDKERC